MYDWNISAYNFAFVERCKASTMVSKACRLAVLPTKKPTIRQKPKIIKIMAENIFVLSEKQLDEKIKKSVKAALSEFADFFKPTVTESAEEKVLTRVDLCCRWNVSKGTLYNYTAQGLITPIKIGRRVLFPMSEVLRAEANGLSKFRGGR